MKLIQAVIRPEKLDDVVEALSKIISGLTVSDVRGRGRQQGHPMFYRGTQYRFTLLPKIMIEIMTEDNKVDDVLTVLGKTAKTGEIGDGRIFVLPIEQTYHIRTGFMD